MLLYIFLIITSIGYNSFCKRYRISWTIKVFMPMIQTLIFSHILQQDSTLHANMNNAKILHTFLESFCNLLESQNTTKKSLKALKIYVSGHVQGVGFRPFIYNLATKLHVCGYVRNTIDNVEILICPSAMHSKNIIKNCLSFYSLPWFRLAVFGIWSLVPE